MEQFARSALYRISITRELKAQEENGNVCLAKRTSPDIPTGRTMNINESSFKTNSKFQKEEFANRQLLFLVIFLDFWWPKR